MPLTEEEGRKIYEEEKARLEVRERLEHEKKSGCFLPVVLIVLVLLAIIVIVPYQRGKKERDVQSVQINPSVNYQGNLLIIKNNDSFSYDYVKVTLNGDFKKELPLSIPPGEGGMCELSDLVRPDGERFNIFRYSPTEISISCESPGLGNLFYHGKFK